VPPPGVDVALRLHPTFDGAIRPRPKSWIPGHSGGSEAPARAPRASRQVCIAGRRGPGERAHPGRAFSRNAAVSAYKFDGIGLTAPSPLAGMSSGDAGSRQASDDGLSSPEPVLPPLHGGPEIVLAEMRHLDSPCGQSPARPRDPFSSPLSRPPYSTIEREQPFLSPGDCGCTTPAISGSPMMQAEEMLSPSGSFVQVPHLCPSTPSLHVRLYLQQSPARALRNPVVGHPWRPALPCLAA